MRTVNECFSAAPRYGLKPPDNPLNRRQVIEAISRCNSSGGPKGTHWVLDPVDGTLGFVRGNQYAVALALIVDGRVVLGVLGCPNYPVRKGLINNHYQLTSEISPTLPELWETGCVMYAKKDSGAAWMQPLLPGEMTLDGINSARPIRVSSIEDPALATFCEPVEKANTSHSFTEGVAQTAGLRCVSDVLYCLVFCYECIVLFAFFESKVVTLLQGQTTNLKRLFQKIYKKISVYLSFNVYL